jgi:HAD superfamily hydrolase (TIGR01509 family)
VTPRIARALWATSNVQEWAERFGIWWGEGLWADFDDEGPPELRVLHEFAPRFRQRTWRDALAAAGGDVSLAAELAEEFRSLRCAHQPLDPDADAVLEDLVHDHVLGLVTNGAPSVQHAKLAGTTLSRYLKAIVISCEIGIPKPDPRIFELALERLGVPAEEAAMVGDSRPRDVAGARAAGMRAIQIVRDKFDEGAGPEPDVRIRRLSELRAHLDR